MAPSLDDGGHEPTSIEHLSKLGLLAGDMNLLREFAQDFLHELCTGVAYSFAFSHDPTTMLLDWHLILVIAVCHRILI